MKHKYNVIRGINVLSSSSIIICGIVRDCAKNLKSNIEVINSLCDYTKSFSVIVFENDSKDKTKDILKSWSQTRDNISIDLKDFNVERTIPKSNDMSVVNPNFSKKRIEKMVSYRNQYLKYIDDNHLTADYVIIIDLDVSKINLYGIIDSFGQEREWDVISANGYSLSPYLSKRYHDSYALVETGLQHLPQTNESIKENQYRFSFLTYNAPMIKVYSAFGGLSIYRFPVLAGLKYNVLYNNDEHVEVRCEHFSLHKQIHERGFHEFYINPNMTIYYQGITFELVLRTLQKYFKSLLGMK